MLLGPGPGVAVLPDDIVDRNVPHLRRPLAQHLDGVAGRKDGGHGRRESTAAAVGHVVMAKRRGICDYRADIVVGNAEFLRRHQRQRSARTAHVDRADGKRHGAVRPNIEVGAGLAAEIEPEAASHAASLVLAKPGLHLRMLPGGLQRRPDADRSVNRTIGRLRAFPGCVPDTEVDRIHADSMGELVNCTFDGEGRHRRRGRAVGSHLGPVDQHLVAHRLDVLEIIAGERGHGAELGPHAGIGTADVTQRGGGRRDGAVLPGTDLDVDRGGAGGT